MEYSLQCSKSSKKYDLFQSYIVQYVNAHVYQGSYWINSSLQAKANRNFAYAWL